MSNPFKIIEPAEKAPEHVKGELMGSVKSLVLILRFVQLFLADSTAVVLSKMRIDLNKKPDSTDNKTDTPPTS